MALLSCGGPGFVELGQAWGLAPSLGPTFICRACQLQAPVFTFQSPLFLPLLGQLRAWADLGGGTQAGQWRLGGWDTARITVKLAQREQGFASHPASQWQGQSPALCPHPLG